MESSSMIPDDYCQPFFTGISGSLIIDFSCIPPDAILTKKAEKLYPKKCSISEICRPNRLSKSVRSTDASFST